MIALRKGGTGVGRAVRLPAALALAALVLTLAWPGAALAGRWSPTGSLGIPRYAHTATLLNNGKVLVTGGKWAEALLPFCELYDPASGTWSPTGSLATARYFHTATLLPDGMVLVAGGMGVSGELASSELYDPAAGTWSTTGPLAAARYYHTATTVTLLNNVWVLVAGGLSYSGTAPLAGCERYSPPFLTWSPTTGPLATARYLHTATLLNKNNGKVLVAGGTNGTAPLAGAELYQPASGTWSPTAPLGTPRCWHTATLLNKNNGKVLVAGGAGVSGELASSELYNPGSGTWSPTGPLAKARVWHTATLLNNGQVLVAGGYSGTAALAGAELYQPAPGTWSTTAPMAAARCWHTATLLSNGKVLVAGGIGIVSGNAELYTPGESTPAVNLLLLE